MKQNLFKGKCKITRVDVTDDTITGRGGLALFVRYLSNINTYSLLLGSFSSLRKRSTGQPIWNIFKQVFCFFYGCPELHFISQILSNDVLITC